MNASFFKLAPNQHLEQKGQTILGISSFHQLLQDADPVSASRTQKLAAESIGAQNQKHKFLETEGFVSTIGEIGSNELKFFNSHDFSLM